MGSQRVSLDFETEQQKPFYHGSMTVKKKKKKKKCFTSYLSLIEKRITGNTLSSLLFQGERSKTVFIGAKCFILSQDFRFS